MRNPIREDLGAKEFLFIRLKLASYLLQLGVFPPRVLAESFFQKF